MELLKPTNTTKASADWFTGDVWFDVIYVPIGSWSIWPWGKAAAAHRRPNGWNR